MAESVIKNYFPSQVVSDLEKISYDYGLKIGKAIEQEWFDDGQGSFRYSSNQESFHRLRLYARGEQSIQKYKDELSINGDLSYLNLDWKPVPIIPKFVDIVVNGIAERTYDIKAYSQDPYGVKKRTEYMESIINDLKTAKLNDFAQEAFGINMYENDPETLPKDEEELQLHMQLTYKQEVEIAEEQALSVLLEGNRYELTKKRFYYDLAVLGIGAVKTDFNTSEGAIVKYVDPANLVYSYTESPYFDDIYYVGEVKTIPINELVKQFPHLTQSDLEDIAKNSTSRIGNYSYKNYTGSSTQDNNHVSVLYFNYKTYMNEVYKVKETGTGADKVIEKDDTFNPPNEEGMNFSKLQRSVEVLYDGAMILGTDKLLKWELCKNMMRSKSDFTKVKMNYSIVAPRMYNGKIESLVSRVTGFADMIQLTHLKLQQVMSRMVPDGVYLDADGLAEVDLGNGTNYNPQEALNMFFQTGSVIGRSMNEHGDPTGSIPIREIQSGSGGQKMQTLIANYNYYLQMIRDTTGLNEARDGSTPDKNALVGVQKLAAANSNTATRHILQAGLFLTAEVAEALSLRISDIIEYSPTKDAFIQAIGAHNVGTLEDMSELHLYDFGIFIELAPDEEEKQMLEQNIQQALQQGNIDLEDAIDLREVKNVKLANELLKIRRRQREEKEMAKQQQNIQAQAQANAQTQQVAAQAEVQKQQALIQIQSQLAQLKSQLSMQETKADAELKKELMALEFQYSMQLRGSESQTQARRDAVSEDRKDIRQIRADRNNQKTAETKNATTQTPKKFESSGNDILGGINLGGFEPR
tara:strand:+ start:8972 stop:11395 length:2424 start_codon:yes stop_codon:yes gene_type:complete